MKKILLILMAVSLVACKTTPPQGTIMKDGVHVPANNGWLDFCKRNPQDPAC